MATTYVRNADGTFSPMPQNTFLSALANEANPAAIHQALNNSGSQIPSVVPALGMATLAISPDTVNHIVAAVATGNPLAIFGTVLGVAITSYATFTKTQLRGITNDQIAAYVNALTPNQLNSMLNADTSNTASNANTSTIGQSAGMSNSTSSTN